MSGDRTAGAGVDGQQRRGTGSRANASLHDVRLAELDEIKRRRKKAGVPDPHDGCLKDDLVGLALSGGGIRSSCFNLGVLQALHRTGVIRFVDYLSTVSGGGYVGAHLSSAVHSEQKEFSRDDFPLKEENDGHRQSRRIQRFIYNGEYLFKPVRLANRYLIGALFNNIAVFSAMVAGCALIALSWRCLDLPAFRDRVAILDLSSDLFAPFCPMLMFAAAWLIAWALSYFSKGTEAPGRWARRFLIAAVASFLIGCALLVGNGNITLGSIGGWFGIESATISESIWVPIVAAIGIALLPLLYPQRLIKSGTRPEHAWERVVFTMSSTALLVGVPLVLIGVIGRENVSGFATHPDREVHPMEIEDWTLMRSFLKEVYADEDVAAKLHLDEFAFSSPSTPARSAASTEERPPGKFLDQLVALRDDTLELDQAQRQILYDAEDEWNRGEVRYERFRIDDYVCKTCDFIQWITGFADDNCVGKYWEIKCRLEARQAELCAFLNKAVLPSPALTGLLLEKAGRDGRTPGKSGNVVVDGERTIDVGRISREHEDTRNKRPPVDPHLIARNNRDLLAVCYRGMILAPSQIRRRVVIVEDQWHRLWILLVALGVLIFVGLPVDFNATSLHRFYKVRLERAYMWPSSDPTDIFLSDLKTTGIGAPYHLICASVYLFKKRLKEKEHEWIHPVATEQKRVGRKKKRVGRKKKRVAWKQKRVVGEQADPRWIDTFIFSSKYCGSGLTGYMKTRAYERCIRGKNNKLTMADAVALSGAAFSPAQTRDWFVAFLMIVLNLRLGQWLPNPRNGKPGLAPRRLRRWLPRRLRWWLHRRRSGKPRMRPWWLPRWLLRWLPRRLPRLLPRWLLRLLPRWLLRRLPCWLRHRPRLLPRRLLRWLLLRRRPAKPRMRPRFLYLACHLWQRAEDRPYCFVTDGGHSENLGLGELLKRRCRLIIVSDAGHDPEHRFDDLARAIRQARIHDGVRVAPIGAEPTDQVLGTMPLDLKPPDKQEPKDGRLASTESRKHPRCHEHFLIARILYYEDKLRAKGKPAAEGVLIYLKPSFTGDEGVDLDAYRRANPHFPHQSTTNQLYDDVQVESYRHLGFHIGLQLYKLLQVDEDEPVIHDDLWGEDVKVEDLCRRLIAAERKRLAAETPPDDGAVRLPVGAR